jgi:hypothetical protein
MASAAERTFIVAVQAAESVQQTTGLRGRDLCLRAGQSCRLSPHWLPLMLLLSRGQFGGVCGRHR